MLALLLPLLLGGCHAEQRAPHISHNMSLQDAAHSLLRGYDSHHRPGTAGTATEVEVNMHVQNFGSISMVNMDYSVDILLRQRWLDERLRFNGSQRRISLSYMRSSIWIPDLFFRNSKRGFLHETTTPNYLIWVEQSGHITFSQKLTVTLACPMQLWNFPMDSQHCQLEIGSYGFSLAELRFSWTRSTAEAVTLNKQLTLNEFQLPRVGTGECSKSYNATGAFSCLFVEFQLVRKFGFYLIYTYLPSVLLVAISWISFWIDCRAVPARITLGLLTVLALLTQSAAIVQQLPRVSYVKAIDVWLFTCLAFVVSSLLEFALVNLVARRREQRELRDQLRSMMGREMQLLGGNLVRRRRRQQPQQQQQQQQTSCDPCDVDASTKPLSPSPKSDIGDAEATQVETKGFSPDRVDYVFSFIYPACFLLFNLLYWPVYWRHH